MDGVNDRHAAWRELSNRCAMELGFDEARDQAAAVIDSYITEACALEREAQRAHDVALLRNFAKRGEMAESYRTKQGKVRPLRVSGRLVALRKLSDWLAEQPIRALGEEGE